LLGGVTVGNGDTVVGGSQVRSGGDEVDVEVSVIVLLELNGVHLALPFFGFSEPIAPQKTKVREDWSWTLWDRFEIDQEEITLQQFIDYFKQKHNLEVTMVSSGVSMIYSFFMSKDKLAERMNKKLSEVVAMVTKQPLPENKNTLTFEICVNRLEDDEEVDVPFVKYTYRK